jgi:hypothetical protein
VSTSAVAFDPEDDEMPVAPAHDEPSTVAAPIDARIEGDAFDEVPRMGDPVPAGVYHVRVRQASGAWSDDVPPQPYFQVQLAIQQEPHVGRVVFDNIPWVRPEDIRAASKANPNPYERAQAQKVLNDRLPKSKAIMEAAGYKPTGAFSFKEFLDSGPEFKVQVNIRERKERDGKGGWRGTGEQGNKVQKYLSLVSPR